MNATLQACRGSPLLMAVGITGVAMLAACASAPPPTEHLQAAQQAIAAAERSEAGRYASGELSEAHAKLAAAETSISDKNMVAAAQFADESRAEAELASATTSAAKANSVNDEMKRSNGTLVDEMQRNSGDKP